MIQPGLVYVIEWNAGGDIHNSPPASPIIKDDPMLDEREKRRMRRDKRRAEKEKAILQSFEDGDDKDDSETIYVAFVIFFPSSFHRLLLLTVFGVVGTMIGNIFPRYGTSKVHM